jgi:hypothetical protein
VSVRAVFGYISQADKAIMATIKRRQEQVIAFGVCQRNRAVDMALEDRDYDAALKLMQDREKLLNLYPKDEPEKPPIQVNNNNVVISESDRLALLALAEARRLGGSRGAIEVRAEPRDGRVLSSAPGDHGGLGEGAGRVADTVAAGAASQSPAPVLRKEWPVSAGPPAPQPAPPGPPGPGEERSVCLECGRRYLRRPGVAFRCPACNPA